jgi:hypothetical protein
LHDIARDYGVDPLAYDHPNELEEAVRLAVVSASAAAKAARQS